MRWCRAQSQLRPQAYFIQDCFVRGPGWFTAGGHKPPREKRSPSGYDMFYQVAFNDVAKGKVLCQKNDEFVTLTVEWGACL